MVNRGRFIREEILCSPVPPPPGDFKFDEKIITEDMTAREKFEEHAKNPACGGCHELFDGLGFALENYDAIGQYRTTEKGKTIDPSGVIAPARRRRDPVRELRRPDRPAGQGAPTPTTASPRSTCSTSPAG